MTNTVAFTDIYPDGAAAAAGAAPVSIVNSSPYPELPAGAIPWDRDLTVAGAATTLLYDPGVGFKFYLVSAVVSTDTANRVAIVDESDVVNQRPVDGFFAANGGMAENLVPKWYESKLAGNRLRLVTAGGNVKCRASGFSLPA